MAKARKALIGAAGAAASAIAAAAATGNLGWGDVVAALVAAVLVGVGVYSVPNKTA